MANGTGSADILEDMESMRAHARRARAADALVATLAAVLSLGGAAVFLGSAQISNAACQAGGMCTLETVGFAGWSYWVIGGAIASAAVVLVRHLRGVRRARPTRLAARSVTLLVAAAIAALFAGYGTSSLGGWEEPWLFPAVTLMVVGAFAARRRDLAVAVVCGVVGAGIVTAGMRTKIAQGPAWWFEHNTGLAISAAATALIASWLAWRWYRQDTV